MSWLKVLVRQGLAAGVILITVGLGMWLLKIAHLAPPAQDNAIKLGGFVLTALGSVITLVNGTAKVLAPAPAPPVDEQLRLLATASWSQWTAAANDQRLLHPAPLPIRWRRSTVPVAGPVSAAMYARFDPLPGLTAVSSGLREGDKDALHRVYGGLPSGRLLLIGPPGSGKSAAAILLLLDALRYREQATLEDQAQIPVPVLFTLHDWHPDSGESVTDWIVGKLAETYPMFRSRTGRRAATDLLAAGRVAGFLDGLDEIPKSVRPHVLTALADAPCRLVLLSRTAEAVDAASHGPLAGAVALELQPVKPTDAADYLLQPLVNPPPAPWKTINDHLTGVADRRRRTSALSEALTTPLALSLLRDVYGPTAPVDELLDTSRFPTAADIENHLLDQAITAAYTPRPGHPTPRYTVATAQRTLRYFATRLTEQGARDLAWWHIPTWTTHRSRMIRAVVTFMLIGGLVVGLPLGLMSGRLSGLSIGLVVGLMNMFGLGLRRGIPCAPTRISRPTYRRALQRLATFGLISGLLYGPLVGLVVGLLVGPASGLMAGLLAGLGCGLVGVALGGLTRRIEAEGSSLGPADIWRQDRNIVLVLWLVSWPVVVLVIVLVPGLASGLASRPSVGLAVVLVAGLVIGCVVKLLGTAANGLGSAAIDTVLASAAIDTVLASVQLTIRHKVPLRLIAFLEDARSRHLLRTVGPAYQFRHAKLQDRLAQPTTRKIVRHPHRQRHTTPR